jgi:hypothetical protein
MLGREGEQRGRAAVCLAKEIGKDILIDMGLEAGNDERVLAGNHLCEVSPDTFRVITIVDRVFSGRKSVLHLQDTSRLAEVCQSKHISNKYQFVCHHSYDPYYHAYQPIILHPIV